jgi:hypothetical protein
MRERKAGRKMEEARWRKNREREDGRKEKMEKGGERERRQRERDKKMKTDYLQVIKVIFVDNACCNSGKHPINSCFAISCK